MTAEERWRRRLEDEWALEPDDESFFGVNKKLAYLVLGLTMGIGILGSFYGASLKAMKERQEINYEIKKDSLENKFEDNYETLK